MPKINNASPNATAAIIKRQTVNETSYFPATLLAEQAKRKRVVKRIYMVPLALMLLMLIASAWLEPAPRHAARGLCVWFDGAMVDCLQRQRLGEGCRSRAGQTINRYPPGGIEQIVADLHLLSDNRHTGPAQLRNVRRHPLTAEPEQGIESGDRQAGD
jgi:hypothetical protein